MADLAAYKVYAAAVAVSERDFTDALREIDFPPDIQAHVDARIEAGASLQSVLTLQAAATTWEELKALQPQVEETNFTSRAASNLIRGDLGLSGSPTCDEVNSEP